MQPTSTEHQFTPPVWTIEGWQPWQISSQPNEQNEAGAIAEVYSTEADANLIAAAPELLIAARNYLVGLEQNAREIFGDEHVEMMDELSKYDETRHLYRAKEALEAAVARAEGRAS